MITRDNDDAGNIRAITVNALVITKIRKTVCKTTLNSETVKSLDQGEGRNKGGTFHETWKRVANRLCERERWD